MRCVLGAEVREGFPEQVGIHLRQECIFPGGNGADWVEDNSRGVTEAQS